MYSVSDVCDVNLISQNVFPSILSPILSQIKNKRKCFRQTRIHTRSVFNSIQYTTTKLQTIWKLNWDQWRTKAFQLQHSTASHRKMTCPLGDIRFWPCHSSFVSPHLSLVRMPFGRRMKCVFPRSITVIYKRTVYLGTSYDRNSVWYRSVVAEHKMFFNTV